VHEQTLLHSFIAECNALPRVPQVSTLVVAEHKAEKLSPATLPAVTAALQLGGPVTLLVAGEAVSAAAQVGCRHPSGLTDVLLYDCVPYFEPTLGSGC